MLTLH
jgi:hypothetical protein